MDYEIIQMQQKTVIGVSARTNNNAPDMGEKIGGLWSRFYDGREKSIYAAIQDKTNEKALGIYTDYEEDVKADYTVLVACEVTDSPGEAGKKAPEGTAVRTIPAGRYARFIVRGDMVQAVAQFWQELWKMDLPRSYICDYEEYQDDKMEDAEIHMYIGLKD